MGRGLDTRPKTRGTDGAGGADQGDVEGAREAWQRAVDSGHPEATSAAAAELRHFNQ